METTAKVVLIKNSKEVEKSALFFNDLKLVASE